MQRSINIILPLLLLAALALPGEASAESARHRVPLVGIYLQPNLSIILPGYETITEIYGQVHPTGTVGFSLHPVERFFLALELEGHGWNGSYAPPGGHAFDMRFLNYWLHIRGRVFLWQRGRWALGADGVFGVLFSREDGERFRSEGQGVAVGAGPSVQMALGRFMALSLNVMIEGGWGWYQVQSPQSSGGDNNYTLAWPRVLVGLAIHGFLVRRTIRPEPPPEEPEAPQPQPEPFLEPVVQPSPPSPFDF
jgi:hypothetical protein